MAGDSIVEPLYYTALVSSMSLYIVQWVCEQVHCCHLSWSWQDNDRQSEALDEAS